MQLAKPDPIALRHCSSTPLLFDDSAGNDHILSGVGKDVINDFREGNDPIFGDGSGDIDGWARNLDCWKIIKQVQLRKAA